MKPFHILSALIEVGAGIALLVSPSAVAFVLLDSAFDTPAGLAVGRVAGAGLLSLGIGCWLARQDERNSATGMVGAMLVYNTTVVAVLACAGIGSGLVGVALWPAVVLHVVMA